MENPEEVLHSLEEFSRMKPQDIPRELDEYLCYVAKTGDPVFKWSLVKCLYREKLLKVVTDFHESTLTIDIPQYPNVDPFNYERMKNSLVERLDSFTGAPFTVQRISELLTNPRKEYNRVDKFMRAIEKNILVVSTREPGKTTAEPELDISQDSSYNGLDSSDSGIPESADSSTVIEPGFSCNDLVTESNDQPSNYDALLITTTTTTDSPQEQFKSEEVAFEPKKEPSPEPVKSSETDGVICGPTIKDCVPEILQSETEPPKVVVVVEEEEKIKPPAEIEAPVDEPMPDEPPLEKPDEPEPVALPPAEESPPEPAQEQSETALITTTTEPPPEVCSREASVIQETSSLEQSTPMESDPVDEPPADQQPDDVKPEDSV